MHHGRNYLSFCRKMSLPALLCLARYCVNLGSMVTSVRHRRRVRTVALAPSERAPRMRCSGQPRSSTRNRKTLSEAASPQARTRSSDCLRGDTTRIGVGTCHLPPSPQSNVLVSMSAIERRSRRPSQRACDCRCNRRGCRRSPAPTYRTLSSGPGRSHPLFES